MTNSRFHKRKIPDVLEMTAAVAADIAPSREITFCLFSSIVFSIHLLEAFEKKRGVMKSIDTQNRSMR